MSRSSNNARKWLISAVRFVTRRKRARYNLGYLIAPRSDRHEAHRRPRFCFRDRRGIPMIIVVGLDVGAAVFRRHQMDRLSDGPEHAGQDDKHRSRLPSPQCKSAACKPATPPRPKATRRATALTSFNSTSCRNTNIDIGPRLGRRRSRAEIIGVSQRLALLRERHGASVALQSAASAAPCSRCQTATRPHVCCVKPSAGPEVFCRWERVTSDVRASATDAAAASLADYAHTSAVALLCD